MNSIKTKKSSSIIFASMLCLTVLAGIAPAATISGTFKDIDVYSQYRVAIIIVGGTNYTGPDSEVPRERQLAFENTGELAYYTLLDAGYTDDKILYLNVNLSRPGVDDKTTANNIFNGFQQLLQYLWYPSHYYSHIHIPPDNIFVLFVGPGEKSIINESQGYNIEPGQLGPKGKSSSSTYNNNSLLNHSKFLFDENDDGKCEYIWDYDLKNKRVYIGDPYLGFFWVPPVPERGFFLFSYLAFVMDSDYSKYWDDDVMFPVNRSKLFISSTDEMHITEIEKINQTFYTMFGHAFFTNLSQGNSIEVSFKLTRYRQSCRFFVIYPHK